MYPGSCFQRGTLLQGSRRWPCSLALHGSAPYFQLGLLSLVLLGCILGLLSCSHLLTWLLKRYFHGTLAMMIGVVLGAMGQIWPWQSEQGYYLPWTQLEQSDWIMALFAFCLGVLLLVGIQLLDKRVSK